MSYEQCVRRVESIVAELGNDAKPLAEAVALYEEAIDCLRNASEQLSVVEQKVTRLVEGAAEGPSLSRIPTGAE
jgi:exodeoxyribonuclease VII small subunit